MNSQTTNICTDVDPQIEKLLKSIADEHGLENYHIKKTSGSIKGDGYLGAITAVEIKGDDTKKEILNLIMKSALKGDKVRDYLPISEVFEREIYMYNHIIPAFQRFLSDKGLPPFPSFAKCYRTTKTTNNETLILENLKVKGYQLWERRVPMNEEHVMLVMKEYGRYHALSFAMRDQDPTKFHTLTASLDDMVAKFCDKSRFIDMLIYECNKVAEVINASENDDIQKIFRSNIVDIPTFIRSLPELSDYYSVVLHGDCWTNNIMFKYGDTSNANAPTQVCFIDLQLSRLGPPVIDTAYFFYACSSKSIIDNFQHYLDVYYNSLAGYLKELGSDPDELYPYHVFLKQWKELAKFGLLMSIIIVKLMLSEQDEVSDFADFAESGKSLSDTFAFEISKSNEYNERMRNIILHFVENKFF